MFLTHYVTSFYVENSRNQDNVFWILTSWKRTLDITHKGTGQYTGYGQLISSQFAFYFYIIALCSELGDSSWCEGLARRIAKITVVLTR